MIVRSARNLPHVLARGASAVLLIALLAIAGLVWPAGGRADILSAVNQARGRYHLPALAGDDTAAGQVAQILADHAQASAAGIALQVRAYGPDADCYCWIDRRAAGTDTIDPVDLYRELTHRGNVAFWVCPQDWSLAEGIADSPFTRTAIFDPRATGLAVAHANGLTVMAFTVNTAARWTRPVWLAPATVDLDRPGPVSVLFPAKPALVTVQLQAGRRWMTVGTLWGNEFKNSAFFPDSDQAPGTTGNIATFLDNGGGGDNYIPLAYGRTYRILTARHPTISFRTAPSPAVMRAPFHFRRGVSAHDRALFLADVVRGHASARRLITSFRGSVWISVSRGHEWGITPAEIPGTRRTGSLLALPGAVLRSPADGKAMVWNMLGRLIEDNGLTAAGQTAFRRAFAANHSWHRCTGRFPKVEPPPGTPLPTCMSDDDMFAGQFSWWATGLTDHSLPRSDPPLLSAAAFGRLLNAYFWLQPQVAAYQTPTI